MDAAVDMIEDRSVDDGERAWGALLVVGRSPFCGGPLKSPAGPAWRPVWLTITRQLVARRRVSGDSA